MSKADFSFKSSAFLDFILSSLSSISFLLSSFFSQVNCNRFKDGRSINRRSRKSKRGLCPHLFFHQFLIKTIFSFSLKCLFSAHLQVSLHHLNDTWMSAWLILLFPLTPHTGNNADWTVGSKSLQLLKRSRFCILEHLVL